MWCLVVFLVTCGFMLACRGHALGVAAGPCVAFSCAWCSVQQMGRWAARTGLKVFRQLLDFCCGFGTQYVSY